MLVIAAHPNRIVKRSTQLRAAHRETRLLPTREMFDGALIYVAAVSVVAAALAALTVRRPFHVRNLPTSDPTQLGLASLLGVLVSYIWTGDLGGAMRIAAIGFATSVGLKLVMPRLTAAGALKTSLAPLALIAGAPWSYLLVREHGASVRVLDFVVGGIVLGAVLLGLDWAGRLAREAMTTHATWRRPTAPLPRFTGAGQPKISIHVPAYAEPPEILIATLDRLARLEYRNFEVIVCDNNTQDEALWRPVEAHCARLDRRHAGPRFRFFHVGRLAGAKAGALNFCLERMAGDTTLVGVIDADYLAEADFLCRLVGFFDDETIGYVQTPHDYREYEANAYLRACYWEYMPSNKVEMPGINEYGAAFTIGTMCLIRADALVKAGRWAEWCLTEDSEVSVRLRALGLNGVYLQQTFGRGLIPETFEDYKKQRFRWTAGPVQQLCRHWRLYRPILLGGSPTIGGWSKLLEIQRAVAPLLLLAGTLFGLVGGLAGGFLIATGEMRPLVLPDAAWLALALGMAAGLIGTWQRYVLSGCVRPRDILMAELARLSLTYIQMAGGVAGLSPRPLAWRRTPKFQVETSGIRVVVDTLPEIAIGLAGLVLAAGAVLLLGELGPHFVLLAISGSLWSAARFFAAPAMALLGERGLASHAQTSLDANVEANREVRAG